MSYNFDFVVNATINSNTIEQMVRKCVEEQTGRKVSRIEFKISSQYDRMDTPRGHVLDGCVVYFERVPER